MSSLDDVYCVYEVNQYSRTKLQNKGPTPLQQIPKVLSADPGISLSTNRLAPGPTPQPLQIAGNKSTLFLQYQAKELPPRRHFPKEPERRLTHAANFRNQKTLYAPFAIIPRWYWKSAYQAQTQIPNYARTACSTLIHVRTSTITTLLFDLLSH